jgi:hypothetical protein
MDQKLGAGLEEAVARIQAMLDPKSQVTKNERLVDRLGNTREFDVVIRGTLGGRNLLGVIECKDWAEKIGTPEVDAFVSKARNVNANVVLMVSRKGFTEPALKQAKFEGVGTLSLLPEDPKHAGFTIGVTWYAKIYRWTTVTMTLHHAPDVVVATSWRPEEVLWQGRRALDSFLRELSTTYGQLTTEGPFRLQVVFDQAPRDFTVAGQVCPLLGISVEAQRECEKKRRWVRLQGDAFYDWHTGGITIPPGGQIATEGLRGDFSDWQPHDGDIPEATGFMEVLLVVCVAAIDPAADVVDLGAL